MARTRSAPPRGQAAASSTPPIQQSQQLRGIREAPPTKTIILPKDISTDARFVMLDNPATARSCRYLYCPLKGLFELTAIEPARDAPRSILFTSRAERANESPADSIAKDDANDEKPETNPGARQALDRLATTALLSNSAQILVATRVDALFFVLPVLLHEPQQQSQPGRDTHKLNEGRKRLFQPLDDMLDLRDDIAQPLKNVLLGPLRPHIEQRMLKVCDVVEAGETMFRINEEKLVRELMSKAERAVCDGGLPTSMEKAFVLKALEVPIMNVAREDVVKDDSKFRSASEVLKEETSATNESSSGSTSELGLEREKLQRLLRLRTSLSFLLSSYVPAHIRAIIEKHLPSSSSPIDFTPLTKHLKCISEQRARAAAAAAMNDNISRKRGRLDDEEMFDMRQDSIRLKQGEEKKKKSKQSRAVRDLQKVDTSGMKKLSSFFGKK